MKKGIDTIGVFVSAILHDGEGNILMVRRAGDARDNRGHWDFGGGSVEHGESFEYAIVREITEEYGTAPYDLKLVDTREFIDGNGHWVGIFFVGKIDREKVYIAEPVYDKLDWFTLDTLPEPMMPGDREYIDGYVKQF